jgi:hypothetical protein
MKAKIIIPTYQDWPRLQMCLDALAAQTMPADQFEVLVANISRAPEVPSDLRLPPNATVIWAEKPGSYAAPHVAIWKAVGEIVFFTDNDCIPDSEWMRLGVERLAALPEADRIAGCVELFPTAPGWAAEEIYDRLVWLKQTEYAKFGGGTTANLIARR